MDSRIKVIDGLRGLAIIAVVWHHLYSHLTPPGFNKFGLDAVPILPFSILANGWLGVNLFFVISGFVLSCPYVNGKRTFNSRKDVLLYYRNRAYRLLPLYLISVIYGFIFIAPPQNWQQGVRGCVLMLTCTFGLTKDHWFPPYNWVMWSLGIEIWFSVLFPFLVISINRIKIGRMAVFVMLIALATRYIGLMDVFQIPGSPYLSVLKDSVIGRLDDFFVGMLIAWFWLKTKGGKSPKWGRGYVLVVGVGLVVLASHLWDYYKLDLIPLSITPLINNVLLAGFFLVIIHLLNSVNTVPRLFAANWITQPGVMCYSIYLWHGVLIEQMLGVVRSPGKVVLYLVVLSLVSYVSFSLIEMNKRFRAVRIEAAKIG